MSYKTRFEQFHTPGYVSLAEEIRDLAQAEKAKSGHAVLYMTQYDIARELASQPSWDEVSNALRLAYTAEFKREYGWGFIAMGSGRSGLNYGYRLQEKVEGTDYASSNAIQYLGSWSVDHLNSIRSEWEHLAKNARSQNDRRYATAVSAVMNMAAVSVESILP